MHNLEVDSHTVTCEGKKHASIDMLEIEMTRITRQLKYYEVQLKYMENITYNNRRTSYTHSHTSVQLCSCNFLCNWEGSTT